MQTDQRLKNVQFNAHVLVTKGNEAADEAARQGAENKNNTLQVVQMPIPAAHAKTIIDEAIIKEWKIKWTTAPHYKHAKLFYWAKQK